jgi:hypothetical protein
MGLAELNRPQQCAESERLSQPSRVSRRVELFSVTVSDSLKEMRATVSDALKALP